MLSFLSPLAPQIVCFKLVILFYKKEILINGIKFQPTTTTTTTTTTQLTVSGMHGDRGDLAVPRVAEVPSPVPGLRHSRQRMEALHAQDHPLKPKPATKMHAQV